MYLKILNNKITTIILLILLFINSLKKTEKFTQGERLLIFHKPTSKSLGLHHINISQIEIYDIDGNKVPLTFHSADSLANDNSYKDALDGNPKTFLHTAYNQKLHKWYHMTYNGMMKLYPRWVAFTFPNNINLKELYVRNRDGQYDRILDMEIMIFNNSKKQFWFKKKGSDKTELQLMHLDDSITFKHTFTTAEKEYRFDITQFRNQEIIDEEKNKKKEEEDRKKYLNNLTDEEIRKMKIEELNEIKNDKFTTEKLKERINIEIKRRELEERKKEMTEKIKTYLTYSLIVIVPLIIFLVYKLFLGTSKVEQPIIQQPMLVPPQIPITAPIRTI